MGRDISLVQGGLRILLMFILLQMLVIKPESICFIDGIIFSWASKGSMGEGDGEFVRFLLICFGAFVLSFYILKKKRNRVSCRKVVLAIVKWLAEVFSISRLLRGGFDIKLWAMIVFSIGTYMVYSSFISNRMAQIEPTEEDTPS